MTRAFGLTIKCPECKALIPSEDELSQWVRNEPNLDSSEGFTFMDKDLIVHRYKIDHSRERHLMMFVEVKTRGADVNENQSETLNIVGQLFRNTRTTPTKKDFRHAIDWLFPSKVWSTKFKKYIRIRAYGYHLLRMSGATPPNSEWIEWDRERITLSTLIELLQFERDPDTLEKLNLRRHHIVASLDLFEATAKVLFIGFLAASLCICVATVWNHL